MLGSGAIIVVDDSDAGRRRRAEAREVLPPRVVRQVHAVPRGHELDGEDARAHRRRRGDADGPRHHGLGPGADHRQLPVRARRRDGDADRLDDRRSSATSSRRTSSSAARAGADVEARRSDARPLDAGACRCRAPSRDDHLHDRRPRGPGAREHDARRRRQVRRRRDPGLLLRAQARPAGRRLPHVPRRDRGHPEAPDRLLDAGQGRHGRPHADRPRAARRRRRSSSSCSSTTRSTARSATRAASARCRTSPSAGAAARSRFIEPKRHFRKPLELSPLIAIDRERCILCYRCVRFSPGDLRGLPARPARARRALVRRHLRRPPLRRAVQRQHHRAVPGRRADLARPTASARARGTSRASGSVCTLCPAQCNVELHRPRRARPARARRATTTTSTTAGCATRAASPTSRSTSTSASPQPLVRDGGELRPVDAGSARSTTPPARCAAPAAAPPRSPAAATTNEEGFLLQRLLREGARLARTSTRAPAARCRASCTRALAAPGAAGDGPRPRVRPRRARARLRAGRRRADPRPAHPQGRAPQRRQARRRDEPPVARSTRTREPSLRFAPGARRARFVAALDAALGGGGDARRARAPPPAPTPTHVRALAALLRDAGEDVVDRLRRAPAAGRAARAARALLNVAGALGLAGARRRRPARAPGRRQRPRPARGRRAARTPARARRRRRPRPRRRGIAAALADGELDRALPAARRPAARPARPRRCGSARSTRATTVVAHAVVPDRRRCASTRPSSSRPSPTPRRRARSPTPTAACSACARRSAAPASVRAEWQVLAELARAARPRPRRRSPAPMATAAARSRPSRSTPA